MIALGIDIGGTAIKAAAIDADTSPAPALRREMWRATSPAYARPDAAEIRAALADLLRTLPWEIASHPGLRIGLCAPGIYDPARGTITAAVNMPGIVGVHLAELVADALPGASPHGAAPPPLCVVSDAHAAAFDYASTHNLSGRTLAISLGTGIGAVVLDDLNPLRVTGQSSGHFGQMDVTTPGIEPIPIGPDGGAGSLEGYLGLPALLARHGDPAAWLSGLRGDEPELAALARAIRIGHAIYRPDHIVLLGGVGIRLARVLPALRQAVGRDLTSLARPTWTMACGDHAHHAALGAARLAAAGAS